MLSLECADSSIPTHHEEIAEPPQAMTELVTEPVLDLAATSGPCSASASTPRASGTTVSASG
jgi:hypothetical protein